MQVAGVPKTLIDVALPRVGVRRDIALVAGFAVFTAFAAQISFSPPSWFADMFATIGVPIEGTPVPITGQTLAVGLTGAALGSRRGAQSMLIYMLVGIIGFPVFAGGFGDVFSGEFAFGTTGGSIWGETSFLSLASGGYIVGFVAAAYLIGSLAERGWDRNVWRIGLALLIGNAIVYLVGLPWLYVVLSDIPALGMDLAKTLDFGLWPFIPGDALKIAIATGALPGAWLLVRRRGKDA
jgi:biotin transport system substrate-specific component